MSCDLSNIFFVTKWVTYHCSLFQCVILINTGESLAIKFLAPVLSLSRIFLWWCLKVNLHRISIPPHSAFVFLRDPVTLPTIVPPWRTKRQQTVEISLGICPTTLFLFISSGMTAIVYPLWEFPLSCLVVNVSSMKGSYMSLYTWYPLTALRIVISGFDDSAMVSSVVTE